MHYVNGEDVLPGDVVNYAGKIGDVEKVISCGSDEAVDYGCDHTGGILVTMRDDHDCYLLVQPEDEEDLELVARRNNGS
jgi:hypothetical protein